MTNAFLSTFAQTATFGVEFEFLIPSMAQSVLADRLAVATGLRVLTGRYSESDDYAWLVKTDGSIQPDRLNQSGFELVSPILTMATAETEIPAMLQTLRQMGATVNQSCGYHIHLGGMGRQELPLIRNLVRRFINFEDSLDLIQPLSRRGSANTYCRSNRTVAAQLSGLSGYSNAVDVNEAIWAKVHNLGTREALIRALQGDSRYVKLNLQSLPRHGTIEFRQGAGTLDTQDALAQLRFVHTFATVALNQERLARRPTHTVETQGQRVAKMLRGVDATTARHIKAMIARNNNPQWAHQIAA